MFQFIEKILAVWENRTVKRFLDENKDLIEQDFKEEISDITKINIDVLDFDSLLSFHELLNKDDEKIFSFIVNIGKKIWEGFLIKMMRVIKGLQESKHM